MTPAPMARLGANRVMSCINMTKARRETESQTCTYITGHGLIDRIGQDSAML